MLMAYPVWRWGKNPTIGAILGAFPIFIATVALIGREFIAIQRFYQQCRALLDRHIVCRDLSPDDFTRFAIYRFSRLRFTLKSEQERWGETYAPATGVFPTSGVQPVASRRAAVDFDTPHCAAAP